MKEVKLESANEARQQNLVDNAYFLYNFISKNPGLSIYELARKLKWSTGKIYHYIQKLLKDSLIKNSTDIVNGRVKKSFYSKTLKEFIKENLEPSEP